MKAGWRDAPLSFRDLAVSNMHEKNIEYVYTRKVSNKF